MLRFFAIATITNLFIFFAPNVPPVFVNHGEFQYTQVPAEGEFQSNRRLEGKGLRFLTNDTNADLFFGAFIVGITKKEKKNAIRVKPGNAYHETTTKKMIISLL